MPGQRQPTISPRLPSSDVAERGVYLLPWIGRDGERYAVAINRRGERIVEATIHRTADTDEVTDLLWTLLDRTDPTPLALLR